MLSCIQKRELWDRVKGGKIIFARHNYQTGVWLQVFSKVKASKLASVADLRPLLNVLLNSRSLLLICVARAFYGWSKEYHSRFWFGITILSCSWKLQIDLAKEKNLWKYRGKKVKSLVEMLKSDFQHAWGGRAFLGRRFAQSETLLSPLVWLSAPHQQKPFCSRP